MWVCVGLDGAGDDLGDLQAVGGDTEERRDVAHQVLRVEEAVDTHLAGQKKEGPTGWLVHPPA